MQFCANKLDKKDFFGKSDPFLVFYRSNEDGTWVFLFGMYELLEKLYILWYAVNLLAVHLKKSAAPLFQFCPYYCRWVKENANTFVFWIQSHEESERY